MSHNFELHAEALYHWGTLGAETSYRFYQHEPSLNNVGISGNASIQVTQGLSLDIWTSYSQIHDQIHLPAEDADLTDILTRRKDIATEYEYGLGLGLNYTFGSIYRSTVNNRFGGF